MVIFDAPSPNLQQCTFETRYQNILEELSLTHPFAVSFESIIVIVIIYYYYV